MADYFSNLNLTAVWNKNLFSTPFRKKIFIALIACLIFCILLVVFLRSKSAKNDFAENYVLPYDFHPIQSALNLSIDPCTDFYEFSCGLWSENTMVPSDKSRVTAFSMLQDFVNKRLKLIFETTSISNELPQVVNDAVRFYDICVNSNNASEADLQYLLKYFQKMGGWPILDSRSWNEHSFDWISSSAFLIKALNIHPVVAVYSTFDDQNTSQSVIYIKQPKIFHNDDVVLSNMPVFQMLYVILTSLNSSLINDDTVIEAMQHINQTDVKWKILLNYNNKSDPVSFTFGQLKKEFPEMDLLHYVQLIMNDTLALMNKTISVNDKVVIDNIYYLRNAISVLNSSIFSKEEIANLFGWFVVRDLGVLMPGIYQTYASSFGIDSHDLNEGMKNKCFDKIRDIFECSLDFLYVSNSSHFGVIDSIILTGYLRSTFRDIIKMSDWLDDDSKQAAIHKLNHMLEVLGFQNYLNSKTAFDEMYQDFPQTSVSVLKTYFNIKAYFVKVMITDLKMPSKTNNWILPRSITDVSAYYIVQKNTLVFPLSLHYPPFYYIGGPWYLNFGAIGTIIGHEIMHGFDNVGSQRDERGNIRNVWSNMSLEAYKKRSMCFKDQYDSFKISDLKVQNNGLLTLNENIADCEGLKTAYFAYKKMESDYRLKKQYSTESTYTPDQMFFISFASVWCSRISSDMRSVWINKDSHSFPELRVNGAVSNSKYFAEVFKCPKGTPMNPDKKCSIW